MKNIFKLILLIVVITTISCNQNKSNEMDYSKQLESDTVKLTKEICSKPDSCYFNLFKGIKFSFLRGSYITDLNNGGRVFLRKINNQYLYRDSQDTVLYDLNINSKAFEDKYEWDIESAKEFIDFCYRINLIQMYCREQEQRIGVFTLYCDIIYTKEQPQFEYDKKLCYNWYLDKREVNEDSNSYGLLDIFCEMLGEKIGL